MKQLLRGMSKAPRQKALQRFPQDVYEDHFEAEFGNRGSETESMESDIEEEEEAPFQEALGDEEMEQETLDAAELDMGDFLNMAAEAALVIPSDDASWLDC